MCKVVTVDNSPQPPCLDFILQGDSFADPHLLVGDEWLVKTRFWPTLRRVIRRIPFGSDVIAAFYAATDLETPAYVKALLIGVLTYFITPIDLIPDFLAGLGFTDDAAILAAVLKITAEHIKPHHRVHAQAALAEDGRA
jgi:uncharacterized membrane protein YkvA (DUF1232 family)